MNNYLLLENSFFRNLKSDSASNLSLFILSINWYKTIDIRKIRATKKIITAFQYPNISPKVFSILRRRTNGMMNGETSVTKIAQIT